MMLRVSRTVCFFIRHTENIQFDTFYEFYIIILSNKHFCIILGNLIYLKKLFQT